MINKSLFRYTELPSLIHILTHRELTLLDPLSWDDKNDSSFIALYRQKCGLQSVLALCFTKSEETYHHWRVFAPGPSGVRIHFDEEMLGRSIANHPDVTFKKVKYSTIKELGRKKKINKEDLPFTKRYPFRPESEWRLLWKSLSEERMTYPVPIELSAISRITLSPWLHPSLVNCVKSLIKSIEDCSELNVYHSTLISNADWLKHGEQAT